MIGLSFEDFYAQCDDERVENWEQFSGKNRKQMG